MPRPSALFSGPHVYASNAHSAGSLSRSLHGKRKVGRRDVGPYWQFQSPKANGILRLRGDLRYYLAVLLEADPRIESLGVPALRVRARFAQRWISAQIDLAARSRDGVEYFFVAVYREQLIGAGRNENTVRRVDALTAWATATGARFAVCLDTQIWRCPQYLSNWAHVMRLVARTAECADPELGVLLCRAVAKIGPTTIGRLCAEFSCEGADRVMATLLGELHAGHLRADMSSRRFSHHTTVYSP